MTVQSLCSRMCRPIAIALLAAALSLSPRGGGEAVAQEWQTIDCATSPLQIDGEARCQSIQRPVGTGSIERLIGTNFNIFGRRGALTFLAAYYPPAPRASNTSPEWGAYSAQRSEALIRGNAGSSASQFAVYRGFGHTGIVEYRKSQSNCVGIDHGYPRGSGYEFFIRGEICSTAALGDPERLVRELMAAVRIRRAGETQTVNGFGTTPVALPWSTTATPPAATPTPQPTPPAAAPVIPPASPATGGGATGTAEQRLRQLQELRDKGLITAAEYETRRKAVLDGL